jgi:hypothetical protein
MTDDASQGRVSVPEGYQPPESAAELLRRYAAGERYFPQADIPEQSSLAGCTLEGAVFESAWLSGVHFRGSNLRGIRFAGCNVKCSDDKPGRNPRRVLPKALPTMLRHGHEPRERLR